MLPRAIDGIPVAAEANLGSQALPQVRPEAAASAVLGWAVIGLRFALGFEFLRAFFDRAFGLGYASATAHAGSTSGSPISEKQQT